jgi:hypothetical protein
VLVGRIVVDLTAFPAAAEIGLVVVEYGEAAVEEDAEP